MGGDRSPGMADTPHRRQSSAVPRCRRRVCWGGCSPAGTCDYPRSEAVVQDAACRCPKDLDQVICLAGRGSRRGVRWSV